MFVTMLAIGTRDATKVYCLESDLNGFVDKDLGLHWLCLGQYLKMDKNLDQ